MKPIADFIFSLTTCSAAFYSRRTTVNKTVYYQSVVRSLCILLWVVTSLPSYGQNTVHGPSVKVGGSTLDKFSFGLGYHFFKFEDDWGWSRPAHNYYFEYLPEFNAFGVSANVQYTLIAAKAGLEVSFRSKNENNQAYVSFFPHVGFDLINGDLSFGPEIVTHKTRNNFIGFKVSLKVHPKLFDKGTTRLKLTKD